MGCGVPRTPLASRGLPCSSRGAGALWDGTWESLGGRSALLCLWRMPVSPVLSGTGVGTGHQEARPSTLPSGCRKGPENSRCGEAEESEGTCPLPEPLAQLHHHPCPSRPARSPETVGTGAGVWGRKEFLSQPLSSGVEGMG